MQTMSPIKNLGFLLQDVSRLLRRRMDQRAHTLGLTSAQWRVLAHCARCETMKLQPMNQAGLADIMDMEPITLSRQIDRMEAAGLIERRPDPDDRRAHQLFVTENGWPLVNSFRAVGTEVLASALSGVSEEEVATLTDVLTRMRGNISGKPDTGDVDAGAEPSKTETLVEESHLS
jgi:MarR family transcriptional regulator for hemolysin